MSSSAAPRYNKDYHRYLVKFMSFKDNIQYDKKHNFDDAQLEDWKPGEIFEWMRQSTLKDVQVSEVDKQTTKFYLRSSTLAVMKKALSWYFVGDRDSQWVTRLSTGNNNSLLSLSRERDVYILTANMQCTGLSYLTFSPPGHVGVCLTE